MIEKIREACDDPGLVVLDVLRKAASIRESNEGAGDFSDVLENLSPLLEQGLAVMLGHHFAKVTDITKKRDAGDRMTGSGALYGYADYALFIVSADRDKRAYDIEFVTRNSAQVPDMKAQLVGHGSARYGGFRYTDTARLTVDVEGDAQAEQTDNRREAIIAIVTATPGKAKTTVAGEAGREAPGQRFG